MEGRAYELRQLTRDTSKMLEACAPDVFDGPMRPDSLAAFLDDPRHVLWFAEADGQVVGFASGTELLHPDKPPQMFINEVGVSPAWRRRGIGRALVSALIADARARGCDYAWLGTDVDNVGGNACFGSVPGAKRAEVFALWEWDIAAR